MYDPIEALYDWLDSHYGIPQADFEDSLYELGLMIMPIEEPINFHVKDDYD